MTQLSRVRHHWLWGSDLHFHFWHGRKDGMEPKLGRNSLQAKLNLRNRLRLLGRFPRVANVVVDVRFKLSHRNTGIKVEALPLLCGLLLPFGRQIGFGFRRRLSEVGPQLAAILSSVRGCA